MKTWKIQPFITRELFRAYTEHGSQRLHYARFGLRYNQIYAFQVATRWFVSRIFQAANSHISSFVCSPFVRSNQEKAACVRLPTL